MPEDSLRGSHGSGGKIVLTTHFGEAGLATLDGYRRLGGFKALPKALDMEPAALVDMVKASGLRGRGGAGFATGLKWSFLPPPDGGPRYVIVNADESEPGTSKDRYILENSPLMMLEGICIAMYAVQAHQAWIYIRGEYDRPYQLLMSAIGELQQASILGPKPFGKDYEFDIRVYRGHGAYICGEETALLESLEGKRAQPRPKPPFPAVKGAWGRPSLINNVETLATVPWIVNNGAEAYAKFGTEKSKGTRLVSVSGHVRRPGVYEIELGVPFTHVINELAGGPLPGRELKCFWPGGSSAPVLPASRLDVGTDMEALAAAGTMAGSGGIIAMDTTACVVEAAYRLCQFYAYESCGKCTPCRVGGNWAVRTLQRVLSGDGSAVDLQILDRIQQSTQGGRCLCPLGDSVGAVLLSCMTHFKEEFEEHALRNECTPKGRVREAVGA
jgi:NADH-quinone oxidoreductase subunit F